MNNSRNTFLNILNLLLCILLILPVSVLAIAPDKADAALANSAWPMFHRDLKHTALSPYAGPTDNTVKWSFTASSYIRSSPVIGSDGTIYFSGWGLSDRFYALYPSGQEKWSWNGFSFGGSSEAAAIASDGTIYISSYYLYALNPDGTLKWKTDASAAQCYTAPVIAPDGTIYVCTYSSATSGKIYAIRDNGTGYTKLWEGAAGGNYYSSPAIGSDGTIYFGARDNKLYAFTVNGNLKWTHDVGNYINTSPAIGSDGTIYFGSTNGGFYAITDNGTNAVPKWMHGTSWSIESSPAIGSDGTIYFGTGSGYVDALTDNGTNAIEKWHFLTPNTEYVRGSPAIGSDGTIYIGGRNMDGTGHIWAITPGGGLQWNYKTGFGVYSSPAIGSDGTVYVGNQDDMRFYAFGDWDNIYVNGTTGNDSYNGGSPTYVSGILGPKKTIAGGIAAVSQNGTVYVAAGTYHEHGLHLGFDMNLVGAGALTTIIDGSAAGNVLEVSSEPFQENTISGFTIRNGAPSGSDPGGGIYISQAHIVTINDCAIINNTKGPGSGLLPGAGGGICNDGGALYMNRCTVSGNSAVSQGGGIFSQRTFGGDSGLLQMTNCTINGNYLTDFDISGGGGIYNLNGNMNVLNCTIANNYTTSFSAAVGGGFYSASSVSSYFKNTIVANNTAGNSLYNNGSYSPPGSIISQGYNIDSENSCNFNDATDQRNTNPLLGPLQNNGGQTSTMAITTASPAFNRGTNTGAPATDQRGIARPQLSTVDIGAFELQAQQSANVPTATGTGAATLATSSGTITSLTASSTLTCGSTVNGISFPHGFFNFNIAGLTTGSTATITITLPSNMGTNTQYWKCINGSWVNVTSLLGSNDGDNVLTITLTDGGLGDADGVANGTIVDPGGPGVPLVTSAAPARKPFADSSSSPSMQQSLPAKISVKYLNVHPQVALVNQQITIAANMANSGDESGKYTATLKINGDVEQVKTGSVGAHVAQPITFTVTRNQPGTYAVDINGQQSSFTITGKSESSGTKTLVLFGTIICAIGALLLGALIVRRRRNQY